MVGGLTYLVDTNVWLELLLAQENADSVRRFLRKVPGSSIALSEFTLYSIAIILIRLHKDRDLADFLADTVEGGDVARICLDTDGFRKAMSACRSLKLDFDDSYQYVVAEKHDLVIVSFDKDFDRTPRGRKTPAQVIEGS